MQGNKNENCNSSCLLNCLDDGNKNVESDEIITRIKRKCESNGIYILVELLEEQTFETLSPDLKTKYVTTKREVSIESIFNNSQILVSEIHVSEKTNFNL